MRRKRILAHPLFVLELAFPRRPRGQMRRAMCVTLSSDAKASPLWNSARHLTPVEPGGGIDMCAMRDDSGALLIVDFPRYGHGLPTSKPARSTRGGWSHRS